MDTHATGKSARTQDGASPGISTGAARSEPGAMIESWVDDHGGYLFRYALPRVRDHHAAEEVVQETFLAALKAWESFHSKSSPRTWLVGILRHKIMDLFRTRNRRGERESLDESDPAIDALFDGKGRWIRQPVQVEIDPAALQERADFWVVFEDCFGTLPELQAEAFSLRVMDDVKSDEICKVLSISSTNLWVLLHRARARLRACLETKWFESDS
jgi:RNA polymerase sigma-70 factor (ECF subfamily)